MSKQIGPDTSAKQKWPVVEEEKRKQKRKQKEKLLEEGEDKLLHFLFYIFNNPFE